MERSERERNKWEIFRSELLCETWLGCRWEVAIGTCTYGESREDLGQCGMVGCASIWLLSRRCCTKFYRRVRSKSELTFAVIVEVVDRFLLLGACELFMGV